MTPTQHSNAYSMWVILFALAGVMLVMAYALHETMPTLASVLLIGGGVAGAVGAVVCKRDVERR